MSKEIGKLIKLLNEWLKDKEKHGPDKLTRVKGIDTSGNFLFALKNGEYWNDYYIISKQCGFIKRLVKNEKVKDLEEIDYIYGPELVNHQTEIIYTPYGLYESLLMLLAIQDNPIEFLISLLK